eukprot:1139220-Pelagomonas_calceolata.AAC.2
MTSLYRTKHREGLEAPAWMHNPPQACCSNDTHPTTSMHINSGDEQAAVTNKQRRPARCTHTLSRSGGSPQTHSPRTTAAARPPGRAEQAAEAAVMLVGVVWTQAWGRQAAAAAAPAVAVAFAAVAVAAAAGAPAIAWEGTPKSRRCCSGRPWARVYLPAAAAAAAAALGFVGVGDVGAAAAAAAAGADAPDVQGGIVGDLAGVGLGVVAAGNPHCLSLVTMARFDAFLQSHYSRCLVESQVALDDLSMHRDTDVFQECIETQTCFRSA